MSDENRHSLPPGMHNFLWIGSGILILLAVLIIPNVWKDAKARSTQNAVADCAYNQVHDNKVDAREAREQCETIYNK